jgi:hypothetical protein
VLRHHFAWKRLSIAGVLAYEPDGSNAHLVFQLRPGAYNTETLIDFLIEVHRHEKRRPVLLIVYHGGKRTAISEYGERQFRPKSYTCFG